MRTAYPYTQYLLDSFERKGQLREAFWLPCQDELSAEQIISVVGDMRVVDRNEASRDVEKIIEQWHELDEYVPDHIEDYTPDTLRLFVLHCAETGCLFYDELQCLYRTRDTLVDTAWREYLEMFEEDLDEIGCSHGDLDALTNSGDIGIVVHPVRISSRFVTVYNRIRSEVTFLGDTLEVIL